MKSMQTVLFLCTGNYYRSRYAEILFNWNAKEIISVEDITDAANLGLHGRISLCVIRLRQNSITGRATLVYQI